MKESEKIIETVKDSIQVAAIHTRAMLISLHISSWTARKYDKKVSREVAAMHNADVSVGRYNKHLMPGDCATYKALMQHVGFVRTEFYKNTLAWSDEGWRMLPNANYMQLAGKVREWSSTFHDLLNDFLAEYPNIRDNAPARLNGMYDPADWPTTADIRAKFAMAAEYSPLPAQGDFRVDLPQQVLDELESKTQDRVRDATKDAMLDAWHRLQDCVKHIHEKTSDPDAIFRDSLIYNARELCDVLGRLNVTGDKDLEAFRDEVESNLASMDPDTLRENASAREDVATLAEDILGRMSAFTGGI